MKVKSLDITPRLRDLRLEGEIARPTTPEIRLKIAFELIEFAENLYQASHNLKVKKSNEH
jgi:hypothetical protein